MESCSASQPGRANQQIQNNWIAGAGQTSYEIRSGRPTWHVKRTIVLLHDVIVQDISFHENHKKHFKHVLFSYLFPLEGNFDISSYENCSHFWDCSNISSFIQKMSQNLINAFKIITYHTTHTPKTHTHTHFNKSPNNEKQSTKSNFILFYINFP